MSAHPKGSNISQDLEQAAGFARRKVLVIEDHADTLESTRLLLRLQGHQVACAKDGISAIRIAKLFQPDVVLLDIGLPDMTGYEVARWLRAMPYRMCIIALTAHGMRGDMERAMEAGCDKHLLKPVYADDLDLAIRSAPSCARKPSTRFHYPAVRPTKHSKQPDSRPSKA